MNSGSFKSNVTTKILRLQIIFIYKDLALDNLERLMCHKTKPTIQHKVSK